MRYLLHRRWAKIIFCGFIIFAILLGVLIANDILWIGTNLSKESYPIRGVDVSHYQGDIDWGKISEQDMYFAIIKATEGSSSQDKRFKDNWEGAKQTNMKVGAYHFFSFESPGHTQAENYIATVPVDENSLPPVVDFEYYPSAKQHIKNKQEVVNNLQNLLDDLEKHYGKKPMIYCTFSTYQEFIDGNFEQYPLWIRSIYFKPDMLIGSSWILWQFSDKGEMDGYDGDEKYIDLNVFNGSEKEFYEIFEKK